MKSFRSDGNATVFESHSRNGHDYIATHVLVRVIKGNVKRRLVWLVIWQKEEMAVFLHRDWAREFINELKVQMVMES